ncbi:MAG: T9SS type A sorting domain-containing protein, partial [Bacteroidota bacterium]
ISGINYVYRDCPFVGLKQKGASEACEVNINCPEGANWGDEKRGVALISIVIGANSYLCSGSLVNNTSQDCVPYFLSAYHCGEGASASDFNQWGFYFGYWASTCTGTTAYYEKLITGATKKAEAANTPGSKSDMLLLQLSNNNFGTTYQRYYNGWNRASTASGGGVCIHHPAGDMMKISTYTSTPTTYYTTHWLVYWAATVTDHGVTEGGSSGSPLFDNNGRVIGTLTGGTSYCTAQSDPDIYGKFSYHWDQNGTTASARLKDWLDPTNTGVTTLDGVYYPCSGTGVTAQFTGNPTTVVEGGSVAFTNQSTGSITSWTWSFPGGSPSSFNGQNPPAITYSTAGSYNVSLVVSDGTNNDTELKTNYITVIPAGTGGCDTLRYPLAGTEMIYGAQPGGYLSGNNGYGDLAKVDYFDSYAPATQIDGALIKFGVATGNGTCRVAVWNGTSGSPGTMIGYKDVNISQIITDVNNTQYTSVTFTTPITIPGAFFLGVVLPTSAGDTVAIITNDDGESSPNTAWEQWSDNSWYAYDDASSWGMSMSHAISPVVCSSGTGLQSAESANISVFPNPAENYVMVSGQQKLGDVKIMIIDITGEVIEVIEMNNCSDNAMKIDLSNYASGVYYINVTSGKNTVSQKLTIIK